MENTGGSAALSRRSLLKLGGAAGLSLTGLTAAAGCSSGSGGGSTTSLKMLYFGDQKSATALQEGLAPKVAALDSKVTLEVAAVNGTDWNDFIAKVLTQIAAGSPPDLVSVATEGTQLMAAKELIVPLDDYVKRDMESLKGYFADVHPSLVESMMYQGSLFELTDSFNAGNMFYNTKLFDKAGIDEPTPEWSIDTFYDNSAKLAKIKDVNAFDWVVRLWGSWTSFMYANGGNLLEEGKYDGGDWLWSTAYPNDPAAQGRSGGWKWGQPTANSAATVEALEYMIELKKAGLSPSPDVGGGGTLQGLFAADRVGAAIGGGFWAGGLTNAGMKKGSFDVQLFPKWKTQRHLFGAGGYAIFKSSKKKDLAWELCKMMVEPETFDISYPGNITTPARKSLMTADRYETTGPKNWSVFYDTLTKHPDTAPIPAPTYYNALATVLNQRTTEALSSNDAKAALDGMQGDLEKLAKANQ